MFCKRILCFITNIHYWNNMKNTHHSCRSDLVKANIVEAGIARMEIHGRAKAADFLLRSGISFAITVRVLDEPSKRRIPRY
ncbi:hypothetical protein AAKU55_001607 [Oxalobacteraceae bacterium GrIS 1.11]